MNFAIIRYIYNSSVNLSCVILSDFIISTTIINAVGGIYIRIYTWRNFINLKFTLARARAPLVYYSRDLRGAICAGKVKYADANCQLYTACVMSVKNC